MTPGSPPPTNPIERHRWIEEWLDEALARDPGERAAFLAEVHREEPALGEELRSLLDHADGAKAFFRCLNDIVFSSRDSLAKAALAAELDLPAGDVVAHYRIVGRVGVGGMGTVYRARDMRLDRDVALKFLPTYPSTSQDAGKRLLDEARAAAALEHVNVCTVHEVEETDDGRPFLVMALYEGETLHHRLRSGPLRPDQAIDIAIQIARGLEAAHGHGLVHRDIKPGNVMLTADGTVKLLDFGLARVADRTSSPRRLTHGTVPYMSPEQARGDAPDPRADLWSLGVVLYEMLTGRRPFRGVDDPAVIEAILNRDPEPIGTARTAPASVQRIVGRLLRKDPDARYQSAGNVLVDLEGVLPFGGRRPRARAGVAAAVGLLVGLPLWLGRNPQSEPGSSAPSAEPPSIAVLPVANSGTDPRDAALADGMTRALITILGSHGAFKVVGSTSVFAFDDTAVDVRGIADGLGVSHVVESTLERLGSRLRVRVRLVDAADGTTRWSETFGREVQDIVSIEEDIARAVASALDMGLTGEPVNPAFRRGTTNVAAYEFYLRGSDAALLRSDSGVRQGVEHFRDAIAADSSYAAAYAGLARLYVRLSFAVDPGETEAELHARAERMALKAVALDDSLAEAHAALGLVRWRLDYDLKAAEAALRRATVLDPTQTRFHQWLGQLYLHMGRPAAALAQLRWALEIDPLSPSAHAEVAYALVANGQYDEALTQLESLARVEPPLLRVPGYLAQAYAGKGLWAEALEAVEHPVRRDLHEAPEVTAYYPLYGHLLARAGRRDEALQVRETLLDEVQRGIRGGFDIVVVELGLGNLDEAFEWLERSIDDRTAEDADIVGPLFTELRGDPRFEQLRPRLGAGYR